MTWNGDVWDFEGEKVFRERIREKTNYGLSHKSNIVSKAFELYLKISKEQGMETQQEVLKVWNSSNERDDNEQIKDFFINSAIPEWFSKGKMDWRGSGDDDHGWNYHEAKWKNGTWKYLGSYFDNTDSWDDWDD